METKQVRDALSIAGLPINWQPTDKAIRAWIQFGYSIPKIVQFYLPEIQRYENHVNEKN